MGRFMSNLLLWMNISDRLLKMRIKGERVKNPIFFADVIEVRGEKYLDNYDVHNSVTFWNMSCLYTSYGGYMCSLSYAIG